MARLTYKTKDGSWGLRGVPWTQLAALPPRVYGALATLKDMEELVDQIVNPTYVGMDRSCPEYDPEPKRKPHVCGDGPKMEILRAIFDQ